MVSFVSDVVNVFQKLLRASRLQILNLEHKNINKLIFLSTFICSNDQTWGSVMIGLGISYHHESHLI